MHNYTKFLGSVFLASLLAACGGGGAGGAIPDAPSSQPLASTGDPSLQQSVSPDATLVKQTTIDFQGTISGLRTGGFTLNTGGASGYVPVNVTSSTIVNTYRASLKAGTYAIVLGTGSGSSFNATYVALYPTAPANASVTGSVSGLTAYGFILYSTTFGHLPILVSSSTSGTISTGTTVTVSGKGSTSVAILAGSVSTKTTASATPTPIAPVTASVPLHVLTGDYFGTPWGTTSVAPSRAKPYLNWVRTAASNGNTYAAAGLKVQVYSDPNRLETTDPLYKTTATTGFAKTCGSSRIYDTYSGIAQYVTIPGSSALISSYTSLVKSQMAQGHIDAMFEDNVGPLSTFGVTFYASLPCAYSDSAWVTGEKATQAALPIGTIFNGLSAFYNHGVSLSIGILNNPKTLGGEIEHCFADNSRPAQGSWPWTATEDTQLKVTAMHKIFQCQAVRTSTASSNYPSRIYTLASFEMTYNPAYSVLWEEYGTPSGLHVMPESQFVALEPAVSASSIAQLKQSAGSYVRVYNACYYAGRLIGKCAMAVNPDYSSHGVSLSGFHHTLALSGNGILDGGTVSFSGAAPPTTLAAESAVIALP